MKLNRKTRYLGIFKSMICVAAAGLLFTSCHKTGRLDVNLSPKFEDKEVLLATYGDSTILATSIVKDGKVSFDYSQIADCDMPVLAQLLIDGRTRACFIMEDGAVAKIDTLHNISGTPLNNKFSQLRAQADSVEDLDDMALYVKFIEKAYNDNKENPIGEFFGTELVRSLEAAQIDSLMKDAPEYLHNSKRVKRYTNSAALRKSTAPGAKFVDFKVKQPNGRYVKLSNYAGRGNWTLVDFWASWCPYCIKEMPQLLEIYNKYRDKGFTIVGVAVRDAADDTQAAIEKYGITWPVIFNAERIPYDIYGFTGIPHLMLIDPQGIIVSRGETPTQIDARLSAAYQPE